LLAAAATSHFTNQPSNSADFELVGQPFFPDFDSAAVAKSLEVVAVDEESAKIQRFAVENNDGLWRIPSHYDYPAEAADRLAETAVSVMGISRDSLAGRLANEQSRLGVLDPLGEEIDDPEAVGRRITLKDEDGEVLVDYIIGKEAGSAVPNEQDEPFADVDTNEKYYYVRRADEQQTYKVKLDIDLSTKFSDWIDPDLLRLDRNELTDIRIDNYTLEEQGTNSLFGGATALVKTQGDQLNISRKSTTDSWELEGLNQETEEVNTARINEMLAVVDEMKLAGVRPKRKFKGHLLLTPDLKLNQQPEFEQDPQGFAQEIQLLQAELEDKGFNFAGTAQQLELVSRNGELELATEDGVVYVLQIGEAIEGSESEIEVGDLGQNSDSESSDTKDSSTLSVSDQSDEAAADDDEKAQDEKEINNRYMVVRVLFDESRAVGKPKQPIAPVPPVKPENYQPKKEKEDPGSADAKTEESEAPEDVAPPGSADTEATVADDRNAESIAYDQEMEVFETVKVNFEVAKSKYEDDLKAFQDKLEKGKKRVDELNERFSDWYYVISADNLKTLQTSRDDIVTAKEADAADDPATPGLPRPNISFPDLPAGVAPATEAATGEKGSAASGDDSSEPKMPKAATEIEKSGDDSEKKNGSNADEKKSSAEQQNATKGSQPKSDAGIPEVTKADPKTESGGDGTDAGKANKNKSGTETSEGKNPPPETQPGKSDQDSNSKGSS
ncbi:MAG: DUF4340 domain-containing protein, partial [Planctomycetota bacterium]